MATREPATQMLGPTNSLRIATWSGLLNGDVGDYFQFTDWADRCVQVSGVFGTGGTVVLEGSNDGTNWNTLSDMNGNAMSYTAAVIKQMNEAPLYVRPHVTGGDGTTSLVVVLVARKINSLL